MARARYRKDHPYKDRRHGPGTQVYAQIERALVMRGPLRGDAIARAVNLPVEGIYTRLQRMRERGLIVRDEQFRWCSTGATRSAQP